MSKRDSWDFEETRFFLQLIRERQVLKHLDGKRFRAEDIFSHLEEPMVERGYFKTAKQMQCRFKTLRLNYNQCKRSLAKSGEGTSTKRKFQYYDAMHVILGERPVAAFIGIDSVSPQACRSEEDAEVTAVSLCSTSSSSQSMTCSSPITITPSSPTPNEVNMHDGNNIATPKGIKRKMSYQQTLLHIAETNNANAIALRERMVAEQRRFITELFDKQQEHEQQLVQNLIVAQRDAIESSTKAFLQGIKEISGENSHVP